MGASAKVVDLSNVKERGQFNPKRVTEGDFAATIAKVEDAESSKDGEFQYLFTFKLKKYSQYSYPYYCKLSENQLWKLRNLLIAAGLTVPKKRIKLDPNKAVGKQVGVTMEDDEYEGKMKSVIAAVFPVSELADGTDDADESTAEEFDEGTEPELVDDVDTKPKKKKKTAPVEEEAPAKKKKKSKKKKAGGDEDLEELDISDL